MTLAGGAVLAQNKIATLEEYAKLMKSNAQANGALNKAVGSAAFADARTQIVTLRQNFMTLQAVLGRTEDARTRSRFSRTGLTTLDALDKTARAQPTADQAAAAAAAKEFGGNTCGALPQGVPLRDDNQTGFRFRPGRLVRRSSSQLRAFLKTLSIIRAVSLPVLVF